MLGVQIPILTSHTQIQRVPHLPACGCKTQELKLFCPPARPLRVHIPILTRTLSISGTSHFQESNESRKPREPRSADTARSRAAESVGCGSERHGIAIHQLPRRFGADSIGPGVTVYAESSKLPARKIREVATAKQTCRNPLQIPQVPAQLRRHMGWHMASHFFRGRNGCMAPTKPQDLFDLAKSPHTLHLTGGTLKWKRLYSRCLQWPRKEEGCELILTQPSGQGTKRGTLCLP